MVKDIDLKPMTAINSVSITGDIPSDAARYNISGQRVEQGTRGIVIVNGKKYIKK